MHVIIRSAAQYQLVHLFEYRTIFEAADLEICVTVREFLTFKYPPLSNKEYNVSLNTKFYIVNKKIYNRECLGKSS